MAGHKLIEFEFALIRYVPDSVKNEFVNIGVVLREAALPERPVLRFTQDWTRARCMNPQIDIPYFEELEIDLRQSLLQQPTLLEQWQASWSTMLQITPLKGCLGEEFKTQLHQLMRLYVEGTKQPRQKTRDVRTAILGKMRRQFEREGVWDLMAKKIAVAKYTRAGDPLLIDCGYRTNGTIKMFQAISLAADVGAAVTLAFASRRLGERVKEIDGARLELTAIIEPIREFSSEQEHQDRYEYGKEILREHDIQFMVTSDLPRIAAMARKELGV